MPSATLPNSRFLHFPKTGGWWVCRTLRNIGIPIQTDVSAYGGHIGHEFGDQSLPAFGFVRHPSGWYHSMYEYLVGIDWKFHEDAKASNLDDFVISVTSGKTSIPPLKDWINAFYEAESNVIFIGKFENLCEDLIKALRTVGERFDEGVVRSLSTERINSSRYTGPANSMAQVTEDLIRDLDAEVFERFEYD